MNRMSLAKNETQAVIIILCAIIFCLIPPAGYAENSPGATAAEFLKIELGARASGLGGAYTAAGSDVYSLGYNPAALGEIDQYEVGFQHNNWFQNIDQNYAAAIFPTQTLGSFGASVNLVDYGSIRKTTLTSGQAGAYTGTYSADDYAVTLSWGKRLPKNVNAGVSLKYLNSSIDSYEANAFALDAGLKIRPYPIWDIGVAVQNLGSKLDYQSAGDPLPVALRLGNAVRLFNDDVVLSFDLIKYRDADIAVSAGAEYTLKKILSFRVGYNSQNDDVDEGLTAGLGVQFQGLSLDYGYAPAGELGNTHKISLTYRFGSPLRYTEKEKEVAAPVIVSVAPRQEPVVTAAELKNTAPVAVKVKPPEAAIAPAAGYYVEEFVLTANAPQTAWLKPACTALMKNKLKTRGLTVADSAKNSNIVRGEITIGQANTLIINVSVYSTDGRLACRTGAKGTLARFVDVMEHASLEIAAAARDGNLVTALGY